MFEANIRFVLRWKKRNNLLVQLGGNPFLVIWSTDDRYRSI